MAAKKKVAKKAVKKIVKKAVKKVVKKAVKKATKTVTSNKNSSVVSPIKFSSDLEYIQGLVNILDKSNLTELELEDGDKSIFLTKNITYPEVSAAAPMAPVALAQTPVTPALPAANSPVATASDSSSDDDTFAAITAPVPGTFYAKPKATEPDFVKVGDTIEKGQVVCLVEAMKNFLKVEADVSGVVKKILVSNENPVEFGQKLILIEAK